jgi:peroxiredoxin
MCREQLGKLPGKIEALMTEAAVLGISNDSVERAERLRQDLRLSFPILSDPRMEVIHAFRMKGEGMEMAEMGYVVIDRQGRIRTHQVDRRFGENVGSMIRAVREAKRSA